MSDLVREPSDDEFSRLMDERAPDRLSDNAPPPVDDGVVAPPVPTELDSPEQETEVEEGTVELPDKYAGKSPAELAQMHMELERRLGQQGQELGQLRQLAAEVEAIKAAQQQTPAPTPPAPWETPAFDGLDEAVMTNPKDTLDWVAQYQPHLYDRAIQTWASLDPFSASRYDTQKTLADERSKMEAELAAVRQPVMQTQQDALLQQAYVNVANQNPLLTQVANEIPAILEENPEFKVALQNGDLAAKERVLNNLAMLASVRGGVAPTQNPAVNAAAAKVAATVASGSAGADRPSGGETATSDWKKQFLATEGTSIHEELARNRARAIQAGMRRA